MIPFMFRVRGDLYVVKQTKCFDYTSYSCKWMCDDILGDRCLVPSVDLTEEQYTFTTEADALRCMKELWSKVDV